MFHYSFSWNGDNLLSLIRLPDFDKLLFFSYLDQFNNHGFTHILLFLRHLLRLLSLRFNAQPNNNIASVDSFSPLSTSIFSLFILV